MKKILVAIMAVLFAAPTFAQYSSGGFSLSESNVYYGIRFGLNMAGIGGDKEASYDLGTRTGMNVGGVIGLRVADSTPLFLESGLYYRGRGAKKDKESVSLHYLEIPLLIKYGIQATDDIAVLPLTGLTLGYAVGGKINPGSHNAFADGRFKHLNMGWKLGCGVEYNKLYAEVGYEWGIVNISDQSDFSAHNHDFFINIGVNF